MITIAIPCLLNGGTEFQTLHLVRTLVFLQQKVTVLVYFETDKEMINAFEAAGAKVHCFNWSRSIGTFSFIRQLAKHLRSLKPKVVHIQYMAPGALPILAAKLVGVKRVIATVHQPHTPQHGWKAKIIIRLVARWCNPFLAVSQNAERSWFGSAQLLDISKPIASQPRHLTLYNCIDVNRINSITKLPESDLPEGLNTHELVIGTVGRMRHEKGIDLLITAFDKISKVNDKVQLLLVGDGPDLSTYKNQVENRNIREKVFFYGSADWEKAMQLMQLMDIVVVPSRFEGFGLTAAEAMAMGKPLIVADNFGLTELVDHHENGLIFETNNVSHLAASILELMQSDKLQEELGIKAKLKAQEKFDIPVFRQGIKFLYHLNE